MTDKVIFTIEVSLRDDDSAAMVRITSEGDARLAAQMVATEHMMTAFATQSQAGFDRALELLCEGARTNLVKGIELSGKRGKLPS